MTGSRITRVNQLIKETVAGILMELGDPRLQAVSPLVDCAKHR